MNGVTGAVYRETIEIGTIDGPVTLARALESLRREFDPDSYNIFNKNCNHFAGEGVDMVPRGIE